jgi:hypothetical protein
VPQTIKCAKLYLTSPDAVRPAYQCMQLAALLLEQDRPLASFYAAVQGWKIVVASAAPDELKKNAQRVRSMLSASAIRRALDFLPSKSRAWLKALAAEAGTGELPPGSLRTCCGCGQAMLFWLTCDTCHRQRFCSTSCFKMHWGPELRAQCVQLRQQRCA